MASLLLLACLLLFAIPAQARFLLPQIKPGGDRDHKIAMIISIIKGRNAPSPPPPPRKATPPKPGGHSNLCAEVVSKGRNAPSPPPPPRKATPPKPGGHSNLCAEVVSKASDDDDDDYSDGWTAPIASLIKILPNPVQTSRRVSSQAYNMLSPRMGSPAIGQFEMTSRASPRKIARRPSSGDFIVRV